jgi:hypothetical protein
MELGLLLPPAPSVRSFPDALIEYKQTPQLQHEFFWLKARIPFEALETEENKERKKKLSRKN